jgi:hypothetical protein
VRGEELRKLKKFNELIRRVTRDLTACSVVPQPTTLARDNATYEDRSRCPRVALQISVAGW